MTEALRRLGTLFYVVDYNSTTFQDPQEVPKFISEAVPLLGVLLVAEWLVSLVTGRGRMRAGDVITSSGHAVLYEISKLLLGWGELSLYQWVYEWRFLELDWRAPTTWWAAALGADFAYYWYHRFTHEVNLAWAAHQVHHSSQDYNLSTALRQSVVQRFFSLPAYTPLALLGIPLPAVIVHIQLNLLYQFWIHTEKVSTLGPLEWVLNTPSHHRVHHGANKRCLDKNYAGVLIIWDRLFGTFEAEDFQGNGGKDIAYGLVHQPRSLNTLWLQVFYYKAVFSKARQMSTWGDSLRAVFYGPGWFPGTPRLGDHTTFPDVKVTRPLYDPQLARWQAAYVSGHFLVTVLLQQLLTLNFGKMSWGEAGAFLAFILASLGVLGGTYDGRWWARPLDVVRCVAFLLYAWVSPVTPWPPLNAALGLLMGVSFLLRAASSFTSSSSLAARLGSPKMGKAE